MNKMKKELERKTALLKIAEDHERDMESLIS